jgi:superfamily II helicase
MQRNPKPRTARGDEATERAILALVLAVNPHYRTTPELSREIGSKVAVRRAVSSLVSYGLIVLHGNTLMPTPAAFHCHRLDAW